MSKSTAAKKPEKGLAFPKDPKGERSTTIAGKNILAAAFTGASNDEGAKFAKQVSSEKNWRFNYSKHFMNMVKCSASSPEVALGIARAGANWMHENFEFIDPVTGAESKFSTYMANAASQGSFHTGVIKGTQKGAQDLVVPYKDRALSRQTLKEQLMKWARYGTIEMDAALSIIKLCDGNLDLTGKHFVLIGAGSAMGPFEKLLQHGATVVCIDIPGMWGERPAAMWQRLITIARNSSGTILIPLSKPQSECTTDAELIAAAGCNLTEQPAHILNWLSSISERLMVGNYTYLDGELHVKLSLAADAIIKELRVRKPDTGVAFLCTPTDIHVTTDDAYAAASKNYGWHPGRGFEFLVQLLSFGKLLRKNALPPVKNSNLKLVDGLSVAQGPNYALAKRLQHWRAMLEYESGAVVSSNIAPSTATLSVVSNKSFGWAYGGMPFFKPYEIFQQETTNALMAALLISDTTQVDSAANPKNRNKYSIVNPLELFKFNSMHGGVWRAAYKVDSIGEISVLIYFLGGPKRFLFVVYGFVALLAVLAFKFLR